MKKLKWYWWVLIIAVIIIIIALIVKNQKNKTSGALSLGYKQSVSSAIKKALSLEQQQADLDLLNKVNICIGSIPDSDTSAYYIGVTKPEYARRLLSKCGLTSEQIDRVMTFIQ